jgi:high-affinity nickel permease
LGREAQVKKILFNITRHFSYISVVIFYILGGILFGTLPKDTSNLSKVEFEKFRRLESMYAIFMVMGATIFIFGIMFMVFTHEWKYEKGQYCKDN